MHIIFHSKQSYNTFQNNNLNIDKTLFKYILVGGQKISSDFDKIIKARELSDNIEGYNTLLTFTAWYALVKNNLIENDFIGLFEYDVIFKQLPTNELKDNTIYGIIKRNLPDTMFLDCMPSFKSLLTIEQINKANSNPFWLPTTNFILPKEFLINFVDWYLQFISEILKYKNHAHYHERAINVFAAISGYNLEYMPIATHIENGSHGIAWNQI